METALNEKLDKLEASIESVKKLLLGNGEIGIAEKARRAYNYMRHQDKTKNGRLDWTFRAVIGILLTFIAVRVGLK